MLWQGEEISEKLNEARGGAGGEGGVNLGGKMFADAYTIRDALTNQRISFQLEEHGGKGCTTRRRDGKEGRPARDA